ncbi:response regulator [Paenibacillus qinlingensis]|uniref:Two-component system response regulator YesN n=1 Tax=Paenibacillus qinlingensis TaxID=1837343 RepID=A0ABU1NWJ6_9BACL|nr:response regulator [Paenibacillus qinlingensis]MDR6551849.1 two-component system response regulator YesN [Paenibacillus qinlingensis]
MIRLMLVDDEPLAVNYLADALMELDWLDAEIIKAYSGMEALNKFGDGKIDLLLTDIRMPGMSGMELADLTREKWPRCRVIFLTGYNDFSYAQTAIRKGGIDYVLKTEGDEAIIHAIRKALDDIARELDSEEILKRSREQLHVAVPSLQRDYLLQLAQGEVDSLDARIRRFAELEIALDARRPVHIALGRIDEWGSFVLPGDRALLYYSIQNIAEEYLKETLNFAAFPYDRGRYVWLVQSRASEERTSAEEHTYKLLAGHAELIQAATKSLLKVPISLILASAPCLWEDLAIRADSLKIQLAGGAFNGQEVLMRELPDAIGEERRSSKDFFAENDLRAYLRNLDLLETYLDKGEREACRNLFAELAVKSSVLPVGQEGELLKLELVVNLSAFLITYVNKRRLASLIGSAFSLEALIQLPVQTDLTATVRHLAAMADSLAEYNGRKQAEQTTDMIGRIRQYVNEFLNEELSLTKLSELVHLSPPYLSRMYKQTTGQGLLEYVTEVRMNRSKQLLRTTEHKIQDIAGLVGLDSAAYFTRLFKKETGVTPLEYRESVVK